VAVAEVVVVEVTMDVFVAVILVVTPVALEVTVPVAVGVVVDVPVPVAVGVDVDVPVAISVDVDVPVAVATCEVDVPEEVKEEVKVRVTVVVITALWVPVWTFVDAGLSVPESVAPFIPLSSIQPESKAPQSPAMPTQQPVLVRILVAMVSSTRPSLHGVCPRAPARFRRVSP
jgi:hypothetical protein